jgi:hypothetical protein
VGRIDALVHRAEDLAALGQFVEGQRHFMLHES